MFVIFVIFIEMVVVAHRFSGTVYRLVSNLQVKFMPPLV